MKKYYCKDCGKEISKKTGLYGLGRCKSCARKGNLNPNFGTGIFYGKSNHQYGENNSNFRHGETLKKHYCIDCKTQEVNYTTWISGDKRCRTCAVKNRLKENGFKKGKEHYAYRHGKCCKDIKYSCKLCGGKISLTGALGKGICTSCRYDPLHKENTPGWHGGISFLPYSPDFTEELKEKIRKRDNYTCQNCGMTEEEHLIVIGKVLCIHHINYDKMNCKEGNLITVCNSCNGRANSNRTYWQEFYTNKINITILI